MNPLIYGLSESAALTCLISALYEKNNPPVSEERDSEISTICLRLFFSYALISNENLTKSTDLCMCETICHHEKHMKRS